MAVLMFGKDDKCGNDPWQCSLKRFKTTRRLLLDVNRLGISEENVIYQERIIILSCIYFTSIVLEIKRFTIDIWLTATDCFTRVVGILVAFRKFIYSIIM